MPSLDLRTAARAAFLSALLCAPSPIWAACTASVSPVLFPDYNALSNSHSNGAGSVRITCNGQNPHSISLGTGSGTYSQRVMRGPITNLNYNLYTNSTRTVVWGDGGGGTATVSGTGSATHDIYGKIPARQTVRAGAYSDTILVTITY